MQILNLLDEMENVRKRKKADLFYRSAIIPFKKVIHIRNEIGFQSYHPYVIFSYYIFVGTLVMYFNHPVFLLTALILMICLNIIHDGGKELKKWLPFFIMMGILIVVLNPFLVSRGTNILFYFRGKQVTLEATIYGFVMALVIIIILMMFISFNITLNGNKFLFIFSRIFPRTAFLVMLTLRFFPLLRDRYDEITMVQQVKGKSLKKGSFFNRIKSGMIFIHILLSWSLEEAIQTADAMKARGYGSGPKSSYIPYHIEKRDWFVLGLMIVFYLLCLFGGFLGYGKIIIYPELGTLQFFFLDWIVYISMLLLFAIPVFVEGREKLRWTYSL